MYGEKLSSSDTAVITIFCIAVVFIVLLVISYVIDINAKLVEAMTKKEAVPAASVSPAQPVAAAPAAEPEPVVVDNRKAILAAAAVAAYLSTDRNNIVVRRISKIQEQDTLWAKNALAQSMVESEF